MARRLYEDERARLGRFPLVGIAVALRRDGDRIGELRVAVTGTNSAPMMLSTDAFVGRSWDDSTAADLAKVLVKTGNPLRTTVVSAKYRRRVMQAAARQLIDGLWKDGAAA